MALTEHFIDWASGKSGRGDTSITGQIPRNVPLPHRSTIFLYMTAA
jgi:hypothetical protein